MNNLKKILLLMMLLLNAGIVSQESVKIMTYNLLNYPGTDTTTRHSYYRTVIRNSNPDILVVQEMTSQSGMNGFLSNVMNAAGNTFSAGTFIDGPDSDNGIFFRTSKFIFISNTPIHTELRDITEFKIIHVNYPMDTLRIYSVHLKASTGSANEQQRAREVDSLRKVTNSLPAGASYIVVGDCNIYGSTEPAYIKFLQVNINNTGHFLDPIPNMTGTWNNIIYRQYHTQSPRVRAFGGGATGGMDDRFDLILFSPSVSINGRIVYTANSLTPYGNDGNHFNDSINKRPNTAVPDSVADAIHYSSDHIPVYAIFVFGNPIGITTIGNEIPKAYKLDQNFPNPFNPSTVIRFSVPPAIGKSANVRLQIFDNLGKFISTAANHHLQPGVYEYKWDAGGYASGVYYYRLEAEGFVQTRKMLLIK